MGSAIDAGPIVVFRSGSGAPQLRTAKVFTIAKGATTTADERLFPLGLFTGRLVDQHGKPVSSARVVATNVDYDTPGKEVKTDDDGQFGRIFTGKYTLKFAPQHGPIQWAYGKPARSSATPITVKADEVTRGRPH